MPRDHVNWDAISAAIDRVEFSEPLSGSSYFPQPTYSAHSTAQAAGGLWQGNEFGLNTATSSRGGAAAAAVSRVNLNPQLIHSFTPHSFPSTAHYGLQRVVPASSFSSYPMRALPTEVVASRAWQMPAQQVGMYQQAQYPLPRETQYRVVGYQPMLVPQPPQLSHQMVAIAAAGTHQPAALPTAEHQHQTDLRIHSAELRAETGRQAEERKQLAAVQQRNEARETELRLKVEQQHLKVSQRVQLHLEAERMSNQRRQTELVEAAEPVCDLKTEQEAAIVREKLRCAELEIARMTSDEELRKRSVPPISRCTACLMIDI